MMALKIILKKLYKNSKKKMQKVVETIYKRCKQLIKLLLHSLENYLI